MKLLFICNQNQHRSRTAEELFQDEFETRSAGLYNQDPLCEKDLEWADIVFVMEDEQRTELGKRFPQQYLEKQIISLGIPDIYQYNQPELIDVLDCKVTDFLSTHQTAS